MTRTETCPICGQPGDPVHKPFCSRRCKDRDMLEWLSDGYRIPGEPLDPEALDSPAGSD